MAAKFYIKAKEGEKGYSDIFVRLQSRKFGFDYRYTTHIEVDIATWQKAEKDRKAMDKFRDKEPAIWAGMDIFDIMKVTGHTTPEMLKRYIKADQLDVVQKLTDKYDYFD